MGWDRGGGMNVGGGGCNVAWWLWQAMQGQAGQGKVLQGKARQGKAKQLAAGDSSYRSEREIGIPKGRGFMTLQCARKQNCLRPQEFVGFCGCRCEIIEAFVGPMSGKSDGVSDFRVRGKGQQGGGRGEGVGWW